jgi:hypothetical protein
MILNFVGFVTMREIITSKSKQDSNPGTSPNATKLEKIYALKVCFLVREITRKN